MRLRNRFACLLLCSAGRLLPRLDHLPLGVARRPFQLLDCVLLGLHCYLLDDLLVSLASLVPDVSRHVLALPGLEHELVLLVAQSLSLGLVARLDWNAPVRREGRQSVGYVDLAHGAEPETVLRLFVGHAAAKALLGVLAADFGAEQSSFDAQGACLS